MKRFPLLVANWKTYPTIADGVVVANAVKSALEDLHHVEVVLCPPVLQIPIIQEIIGSTKLNHLNLGVQNIHHIDSGAYTGETPAAMVKGLVDYAIVGHSERIKYFHESPYETNQKLLAALKHRLTPIVAVGELKKDASAIDEVSQKLMMLIRDVDKQDYEKIVIAYEPVWAITGLGSGQAATGEYAQKVARSLKKVMNNESLVLYGGSVDSRNIAEFLHQEDIDGALVGSASVRAKEFIRICRIASEIR